MLRICTTFTAFAAVLGGATAPSAQGFPQAHRPVAGIVSPSWGDADQRDQAHEVAQISARLHLKPGMAVADIGAGSGYDTLRLARVVGPRGNIFAEDITPAYLAQLRGAVARSGLHNVQVVQGEAADPRLPPHSVDAAIMVHMYHEIAEPYALLARLALAFKLGGRLGIEELDRPTQDHGTPPRLLECELNAAGYRKLSLAPLEGDLGYFAVFAAPSGPVAIDPKLAATCRA